MSVLEQLQIGQWFVILLLLFAIPVTALLRWRRRALLAEAQVAEVQRAFAHKLALLDAAERVALERALEHPQPHRNPPARIEAVLKELTAYHHDDPYAIPIGWQVGADGTPDLLTASLHGESDFFTGNVLITAMTRWGKNVLEFQITICLLLRNSPSRLQVFYVDGKGPDGNLLRGVAHNWREPVCDESGIPGAIQALDTLRKERMALLAQHAVTKWEELPPDARPPLVWVVVNELTLLEQVLGKALEGWLEAQLASALAGGIRYCIVMQDAANWATGWRRNVGLAIAGGQVSREADKPNLGFSTAEIKERGAIPPSELPERCWFTARLSRDVETVSIGYLDINARKALLEQLRTRLRALSPVVAPTGLGPAPVSAVSAPVAPPEIPRTNVPAGPAGGRKARLALILDDEDAAGTPGTAPGDAVRDRTDLALDAVIEAVLREGGTLTDEQIKYLHFQRGLSPSKIAISRGLRGQKQARLDRVYAALGIPRDRREHLEA